MFGGAPHAEGSIEARFHYFNQRVAHRMATCRRWVKEQGISGALRQIVKYVEYMRRNRRRDWEFDRHRGVNTRGPVGLWHLRIKSANVREAFRYEGVDPELLRKLLLGLSEDLSSFTFIDLGCGKGRGLVVAHECGFPRLIGVEFAAELAAQARKNCRRIGADAIIFNQDATEFRFPSGNKVVFMYNPFGASVLARVLENLLHDPGGSCYLVYVNAVHRRCVEKYSDLQLVSDDRAATVWKIADFSPAVSQRPKKSATNKKASQGSWPASC